MRKALKLIAVRKTKISDSMSAILTATTFKKTSSIKLYYTLKCIQITTHPKKKTTLVHLDCLYAQH